MTRVECGEAGDGQTDHSTNSRTAPTSETAEIFTGESTARTTAVTSTPMGDAKVMREDLRPHAQHRRTIAKSRQPTQVPIHQPSSRLP